VSRRQIILGVVLGLVLLVIPTVGQLAIAEVGRQQNVQESRAACERAVPRNVAAINSIRAQTHADQVAAGDSAVPKAVRATRRAEIKKDARYALILDSQTDQSAWRSMDYTIDRSAIRYGVHGAPPFRCDQAFPPARFLP
jgi:hypothetical protein